MGEGGVYELDGQVSGLALKATHLQGEEGGLVTVGVGGDGQPKARLVGGKEARLGQGSKGRGGNLKAQVGNPAKTNASVDKPVGKFWVVTPDLLQGFNGSVGAQGVEDFADRRIGGAPSEGRQGAVFRLGDGKVGRCKVGVAQDPAVPFVVATVGASDQCDEPVPTGLGVRGSRKGVGHFAMKSALYTACTPQPSGCSVYAFLCYIIRLSGDIQHNAVHCYHLHVVYFLEPAFGRAFF
jgi:hypothetical protein